MRAIEDIKIGQLVRFKNERNDTAHGTVEGFSQNSRGKVELDVKQLETEKEYALSSSEVEFI